jgi:hypothetical protein
LSCALPGAGIDAIDVFRRICNVIVRTPCAIGMNLAHARQ